MNKLLLICSLDEEKSIYFSSIKSTQKIKQSNLEETFRYPHGKQETNSWIYSLILLFKQEKTKE
jgi:hypothetical protein